MPITTFEQSAIADSFGPGFPFGFRSGNFLSYLEIDNLNTNGSEDFGIVRSSAGYNFHAGIVPFANGTDPTTDTSTIRLTSGSSFFPAFEVVSIKLDTLVTGTGGTVTFTGLKSDGITTVTHVVTLDTAQSLEMFILPDSFNDLIQLDIEGPANFQFDDIDIKTSVIGTAGIDLIVLGDGSWFVNGDGGDDQILWQTDTFGTGEVTIDGGDGANDWLTLRGAVDFSRVTSIANVETIELISGNSITSAGPVVTTTDGHVGHVYDYTIVASDAHLQAGEQRTIRAIQLTADEQLIFDASAETDGRYIVNSGAGADYIIGGALGDEVSSASGNDTVLGGGGADVIVGGAGLDTLLGGTGNDQVFGSSGVDFLDGGDGEDVLDGGSGEDIVYGGDGNDTISDAGFDNDTMFGGGGNDLIFSFEGNDVIDGGDGNDTIFSGDDNDIVTGGSGSDQLNAGAGNDTINGGTGADAMTGGLGNDVYFVDAAGDAVIELIDQGTDAVFSSVTFILGDNVENLFLTGASAITGSGNALNNALVGNAAANTLNGGGGNDTLNGGGGADAMFGGAGDDTYHVDNAGDTAVEGGGLGTDRVISTVTFTLGAQIENLTLSGAGAINGTGNSLANGITGTSGNNVLNGGTGADTMIGGLGDDIYHVDNGGDAVVEGAAAGTDAVFSSVTFTLAANVENLFLTGSAVTASGNALNNALVGNSAANTLNGGGGNDTLNGGLGADAMFGGAGDDTYHVDNAGDTAVEGAGLGTDRVISTITFVLGANIENLTLSGAAAINGFGNALGNGITGNGANNILSGADGDDILDGGAGNDHLHGGLGNDSLVGGTGADRFVFNTALNDATNVDTISGFSVVDDTIALDQTIFFNLPSSGTLAPTAFRAGTAAADADDRIIYDSATGNIYYDADGDGAGAQVLFAQVALGTALTNADFLMVP